jgi:hypothetical protein
MSGTSNHDRVIEKSFYLRILDDIWEMNEG